MNKSNTSDPEQTITRAINAVRRSESYPFSYPDTSIFWPYCSPARFDVYLAHALIALGRRFYSSADNGRVIQEMKRLGKEDFATRLEEYFARYPIGYTCANCGMVWHRTERDMEHCCANCYGALKPMTRRIDLTRTGLNESI